MRTALLAVGVLAFSAAALRGQAQKPPGAPPRAPSASMVFDQVSVPREAIRDALGYLGVPYVSGGTSMTGVDCSGLVFRVLRDTAGLSVPRSVEALFHAGSAVTYPMHIGDLVFFDTESQGHLSAPTHVGLYVGSGKFIHAASEGSHTGVIVSLLENPYYHDRFLGARRLIPWRQPVLDLVLTDTPRELTTTSPFPSREKMAIEVFNRMTGGGPMDLTISKDGMQVLATRIAPGAAGPSVVSLVPDAGTWDVRVNRLWRGRELERVTFHVEE